MASKWTSSDLVTFYLILLSLSVMFLPPYCVLFIKVEYNFLSHIQIFWNFNFLCFEYSADWDSADLFVLFCRYRFMHEQRRMEPETKLWSIFVFSLRSDSDSNLKFSENQIRGPRADRRYADYRKCADIGSIATLNVLTLVSFFCFIDFWLTLISFSLYVPYLELMILSDLPSDQFIPNKLFSSSDYLLIGKRDTNQ